MQSIWRAIKVRRKFREEKRIAIQAIVTIQRHYRIYLQIKARIIEKVKSDPKLPARLYQTQ